MIPLRKILAVLVIVLSILILWYQLRQRSSIMKLPANAQEAGTEAGTKAGQEGLANSAPSAQKNELQLMTVVNPGAGVSTYNVLSMGNLPLQEFCINRHIIVPIVGLIWV